MAKPQCVSMDANRLAWEHALTGTPSVHGLLRGHSLEVRARDSRKGGKGPLCAIF